jgi:hypothetical protein
MFEVSTLSFFLNIKPGEFNVAVLFPGNLKREKIVVEYAFKI